MAHPFIGKVSVSIYSKLRSQFQTKGEHPQKFIYLIVFKLQIDFKKKVSNELYQNPAMIQYY